MNGAYPMSSEERTTVNQYDIMPWHRNSDLRDFSLLEVTR